MTPGLWSSSRGRSGRLHLRDALAIERREIHRLQHEWREAAVAYRTRHDLAREGKQQARTLDEDDRVHGVRRYVLNPEHSGIKQFEAEQQVAPRFRLALELERDLDVALRERLRVDVDLDADLRLLLADAQRTRRVRILEGKVLDVLRKHVELRLRRGGGRSAVGRRHEHFLRRKSLRAVRTCTAPHMEDSRTRSGNRTVGTRPHAVAALGRQSDAFVKHDRSVRTAALPNARRVARGYHATPRRASASPD